MKNLIESKKEEMKLSDRHDTASLSEAQFEPGSRGRVLKNRLERDNRTDTTDKTN